jgi:hypothetical protein
MFVITEADAGFHRLADVLPEVEWFANFTNRHSKRAFAGISLWKQ